MTELIGWLYLIGHARFPSDTVSWVYQGLRASFLEEIELGRQMDELIYGKHCHHYMVPPRA